MRRCGWCGMDLQDPDAACMNCLEANTAPRAYSLDPPPLAIFRSRRGQIGEEAVLLRPDASED